MRFVLPPYFIIIFLTPPSSPVMLLKGPVISLPLSDRWFLSLPSFLPLSSFVQLKPKPPENTSATRREIGAVVESEMIPPRARRAEAQGFKQLQA